MKPERPDVEDANAEYDWRFEPWKNWILHVEKQLEVALRYCNRDIKGQIEEDPEWTGGPL